MIGAWDHMQGSLVVNTSYSFGEHIRQLRRQRSLTQTELGAGRYSKSYVSALERGTIVPSQEALCFFAEQLNQPIEAFEQLLEKGRFARSMAAFPQQGVVPEPESDDPNEVMTLLDLLLARTGITPLPSIPDLPRLSAEAMSALPLPRQARYAFWRGLVAQQEGELAEALSALEYALALAPAKHQPAILDALGLNYYLERQYHTALSYHRRAHALLEQQIDQETTADLPLLVALHCGDDCRALNACHEACGYYDQARQHLQATHNLRLAAQVYQGLGYCTYAALIQRQVSSESPGAWASSEEQHEFRRAISLLVQSRTLYQASHDLRGELSVRLMQAVVLLDFSLWRRRVAQAQTAATDIFSSIDGAALLEDAEEQCRQALISLQEADSESNLPPVEQEMIIYTAVASLISIYGQRATLARLGGYEDTAARERVRAALLCQQALDTFCEPEFAWDWIQTLASLSTGTVTAHMQPLPRLPDPAAGMSSIPYSPVSQMQIYLAAGEVAEELGRAATTPEYKQDCYARADQCFQMALQAARQVLPDQEHDPGYLVRCYQRAVQLVEERMMDLAEAPEGVAPALLSLLKDGLTFFARSHLTL
jgi:tetratricopeptide (TPR) repeat protein